MTVGVDLLLRNGNPQSRTRIRSISAPPATVILLAVEQADFRRSNCRMAGWPQVGAAATCRLDVWFPKGDREPIQRAKTSARHRSVVPMSGRAFRGREIFTDFAEHLNFVLNVVPNAPSALLAGFPYAVGQWHLLSIMTDALKMKCLKIDCPVNATP